MNNSVGVPFSSDASLGTSDEYWIHVEQVLPESSTATLGEVAALVDALFGIDPCDEYADKETTPITEEEEDYSDVPESDFREGIITQIKAAAAQEKALFFQEQVKKNMGLGVCDIDLNSGDYNAQLKIGRSHREEDYKLLIQVGRVTSTVEIKERFSETYEIEGGHSLTLDFPVVYETDKEGSSEVVFEFENVVYGQYGYTTAPLVTLEGRVLSWDGPVTGALTVSYPTRYDLVDIVVSGVGEESEDASSLCFYKGTVEETDIVAPESNGTEIDKQMYCDANSGATYNIAENDDVITCYENVRYNYVCRCSPETIAYSRDVKENVQCPSSIKRCTRTGGLVESADGRLHCEQYMGSRTVIADYVSCNTPLYNNQWDGFASNPELDGVSDPEYYEKICCVPPDEGSVLPVCSSLYEKNGGQELDEAVLAELERRYGEQLRLIPVKPEDGDCGYINTVIGVKQQNCCVGVEPLVWDADNSVEVLADSASGIVSVAGGKLPLQVSVRGTGFYLDVGHTLKEGSVNGTSFYIYTDEDACGVCAIAVSDGCSDTVTGYVRSVNGTWVVNIPPDWSLGAPPITEIGGNTYFTWSDGYDGRLWHRQQWRGWVGGQSTIQKACCYRSGTEHSMLTLVKTLSYPGVLSSADGNDFTSCAGLCDDGYTLYYREDANETYYSIGAGGTDDVPNAQQWLWEC